MTYSLSERRHILEKARDLLARSNPNHEPAGSSDGGQFSSGDGGGGGGSGGSGSSGGGGTIVTLPTDNQKKIIDSNVVKLNKEAAALEEKRPTDRTREEERKMAAIQFVDHTWSLHSSLKLSQAKNYRFAYLLKDKELKGAGVVNRVDKNTAKIEFLGAVEKGSGSPVLSQLEKSAIQSWKPSLFTLHATYDNQSFYERHGYVTVEEEDPLEIKMEKVIK